MLLGSSTVCHAHCITIVSLVASVCVNVGLLRQRFHLDKSLYNKKAANVLFLFQL